MTAGSPLEVAPGSAGWPRRLVCVCANPSIDRIAAVDRLVPGEVHRPEPLSVVPGGKALNVARAAARLGMPVRAIAVLGGHAGAWMDADLHTRGIATRIVRVAGETRTCLSVLDHATGLLTEFYEPGLAVDEASWGELEAALRWELAEDPLGALVVLAGSLPPGSPEDGYRRLAESVSEAGGRAVVDTDRRALVEALGARPWLVKVNAREAVSAAFAAEAEPGEGLAPAVEIDEARVVEAARRIRRQTSGLVMVTRGPDGAILVDEVGSTWRIGGPPERGQYPVGSGDTLLAGFAVALWSGRSAVEAARHGGALGAANALIPGQGEFDDRDADRILPAIRVDRIS